MRDPVIILAAPHSFTSIVSTILGQHPQMYGLPEVNLFLAETMQERAGMIARPRWQEHGLLRVVAQLFMGQQTVQTIARAREWVNARRERTCVSVFRELAAEVSPRMLVDKSPRTVARSEYLQRVRWAFPGVKFIHLLRHPRSTGQSMSKSGIPRGGLGAELLPLAPIPVLNFALDYSTDPPMIDFQKTWYSMQMNILTFLDGLSEGQKMRIRGEDLLAEPDAHLRKIAKWLGVREDEEAIEAMKHPERSPYACFGPVNARLGNNPGFLKAPTLRRNSSAQKLKLEGALSWRGDGGEFSPEVRELAREFGYT